MSDPRIVNLARTLVHYSVEARPGDHVAILGGPSAAPLIREVFREVLRAGAFPYPMVGLDGLPEILFSEASEDQLRHVSRVDRMVRSEFEAMINIGSATNTRSLGGVDPARQRIRSQAYGELMRTFLERSAAGRFRWVGTLYPTEAYAQDAEMSLDDFSAYVYGAVFADTPDAVAAWHAVHDEQQRLVDWLAGRRRVRVEGPNVDMTLSIEGRSFVNSDGHHNMPSGEIFTGPVEDSAEGWVRFTYPAVTAGREVEGIELVFERGRVVQATARKNEAFLVSQLDTDAGSRYLGEWAIGTNRRIDRFIKNILFDEKIGGTIHMAVGAGYPETGSVNRSALHWDMICDMRDGGRILVDDELFYENGEFVV